MISRQKDINSLFLFIIYEIILYHAEYYEDTSKKVRIFLAILSNYIIFVSLFDLLIP